MSKERGRFVNGRALPAAAPPAADPLGAFLRPGSVAVIGASARRGFAATTLRNLVAFEFPGRIYPVNPKYRELAGLPCYPSLAEVPGQVDLALVLVPAAAAPEVLDDCGAAGVRAAVVYASGYAETGEQGRLLQNRIAATARANGIRLLGPNCMGMFYQPSGLAASFTASLRPGMRPGQGAAYVGQSGAIGGALLGMAQERGFGLTAWFSTGNEADLGVAELTETLIEQDDVQVVGAYLENVPEGAAWTRLTARVQQLGKRLVVLRSGRSEAGRRAAASHTGAMVRPDAAYTLVNRNHGVIEVGDVDELLDTIQALVSGRPPSGPAIAVITSSGGAGSILADHLDGTELTLAELGPATRTALAGLIPDYGSVANPVDVTAQLFTQGDGAFEAACRPLLEDDAVDALSVLLTTVTGELAEQVAAGLVRLSKRTGKHLGVVWMAAEGETREARRTLHHAGIPVTSSVPAHVALVRNLLPRPPVPAAPLGGRPGGARGRLGPALVEGLFAAAGAEGGAVSEAAGGLLLDAVGIPRPQAILATSESEAVAAAARLGGPLVLKVQSPQIPHKSDIGGVRIAVAPADAATAYRDVRAAGDRVPGAHVEGVLVQSMAAVGLELILGVRGARDGYPPVLTVGIGGVTTEIYADVASALAPVTPEQALDLLRSLRGWPLLDGYRGRPPAAIGAVADALVALAEAAVELGERLDELEINPLAVDANGVTALDLLIRAHSRK
jgi:acyl-CoA synthetase (NDP forming)